MKNSTNALKEFFAYCMWPAILLFEIGNFPPRYRTEARWCVFWVVVATALLFALVCYLDSWWIKVPLAIVSIILYFVAGLFLAIGLIAAVTPEEEY